MSPEIGTRALVRVQRSNGWDFGYVGYASYRSFSVLILLRGLFSLFPWMTFILVILVMTISALCYVLTLIFPVNQLQPE